MTTTWTDIPKASGTPFTSIPRIGTSGSSSVYSGGDPIGLLLALTYTTITVVDGSTSWTDIAKAANTSWSDIPKAT